MGPKIRDLINESHDLERDLQHIQQSPNGTPPKPFIDQCIHRYQRWYAHALSAINADHLRVEFIDAYQGDKDIPKIKRFLEEPLKRDVAVFGTVSAVRARSYYVYGYESCFVGPLRTQRAILEVADALIAPGGVGSGTNALEVIDRLLRRFPVVANQLLHRHGGRETLKVNDEYDAQDLLHALLRVNFDDVREEESTSSYAGHASRIDFLLKVEGIAVELKMPGSDTNIRNLRNELIVDSVQYREAHPDCHHLVIFVYDPLKRITNPNGFEADLNKQQGVTTCVVQG
ncbi:MAG TPA: malate dehydrogenase [Chloroflexia bacterium]|jgi:hypothetical protein